MTCHLCPKPGHDFVLDGLTYHRCDEHEEELRRWFAATENGGRPCVKCGTPFKTVDGVTQLQGEYCAPGRSVLSPDAFQTTAPHTECSKCGDRGAKSVTIAGTAYLHPLCGTCAEAAGADDLDALFPLRKYPKFDWSEPGTYRPKDTE